MRGCKKHIKMYLDLVYDYKSNVYFNIIIEFVMFYLSQKVLFGIKVHYLCLRINILYLLYPLRSQGVDTFAALNKLRSMGI